MKKWKKLPVIAVVITALMGLFSTAVYAASGEDGDLQPEILQRLYDNFVKDDRWKYLVEGLGNTALITLFAMVIGVVVGFLLAIISAPSISRGLRLSSAITILTLG